jgi:hypothetical protein
MVGGDNFLKLAEQNTFLKNQMKVQKATKKFFSELTKNNQLNRQFGYLDKGLKGMIQDFVPNAKLT